MGDFNIIPERMDAAHPDDWQGDALFQDEVRALYRAILYLGYTDALKTIECPSAQAEGPVEVERGPRAKPEGPDLSYPYTFWDYQAGAWQRNNGIRIDHVLLSPRLADRLVTAYVDRAPRALDRPSDHTPVVVELAD
jgi:exodeoxyribonuclease-3